MSGDNKKRYNVKPSQVSEKEKQKRAYERQN
jgi:hypothetical protein